MKKYILSLKSLLIIALVLPMAMTTACSDDDQYFSYDLKLSDAEYTFPAQGGEFTVTVTTVNYDGDWNIEIPNSTESWVTEVGRTLTTVTFLAEENDDPKNSRELTVKFTYGEVVRNLTLHQLAGTDLQSNFIRINGGLELVSPSGKYIVTHTAELSEEGTNSYVITAYDTDLREYITLLEYTRDDNYNLYAISDTGIIVGSEMPGGNVYGIIIKDGVVTEHTGIECPAGYIRPVPKDISKDGSIMVGYASREGYGQEIIPLKWTNGSVEVLEYPEYAREDSSWETGGASCSGISPDGNIIYGFANGFQEAIYWKDGDTMWKYLGPMIAEEVDEIVWGQPVTNTYYHKIVMSNDEASKMSSNNRYLACSFQAMGIHPILNTVMQVSIPAIYDFETDEVKYFADNNSGAANGCSNEGDLFMISPSALPTDCVVWERATDTLIEPAEWIYDRFKTIVPENIFITRVSSNPDLVIGSQIFITSTVVHKPFVIYQPS